MAKSTGPILTVGAITWGNAVVLSPRAPDDTFKTSARIAVGTGIAAGVLALLERVSEGLAKGIAWIALVAVVFTSIGGQPAPAENLLRWWNNPT